MRSKVTQELIDAGFKHDRFSPKSLDQQIVDFCNVYAYQHCEDGCRVDDLEEEYHDIGDSMGME